MTVTIVVGNMKVTVGRPVSVRTFVAAFALVAFEIFVPSSVARLEVQTAVSIPRLLQLWKSGPY